jgi:hypothetical protein
MCADSLTFSKALFERWFVHGCNSSSPVFVSGMSGSGTTLVEQMLASYRKIFGASELGVIPNTIAGFERWERHTGSGRHYPNCIDDLSDCISKDIAENILKELQALDSKSSHVIDKLPHNFENVGLTKFLFPNTRLTSVRCDPRDIELLNYFADYQIRYGDMCFAYDLEWIGE